MRYVRDFRFASLLRTLLVAAALPLMLTSCGGGYGSGGGGGGGSCGGAYNSCPPPTVTLTAPASNASVHGTVALTATATPAAGYGLTITRVDFMVDGANVGTVMASPYTVNWNSASVGNGSHTVTAKATDSSGGTATSSGTVVTVSNAASMALALEPAQIFPAPVSRATGRASLHVDFETGAIRGGVGLSGMNATAVSIRDGFAGSTGGHVMALRPAGAAGAWAVPEGALLSPEQTAALLQGRLYVIAASAAHPLGEIRGQILPGSLIVRFTDLAVSPEAAALGIRASGVAATTVDLGARTLTMQINSRGLEDATAAQALSGGSRLAALVRDGVDMGHWSMQLAAISDADLARFRSGGWSVSIATTAAPDGAIGGEIASR